MDAPDTAISTNVRRSRWNVNLFPITRKTATSATAPIMDLSRTIQMPSNPIVLATTPFVPKTSSDAMNIIEGYRASERMMRRIRTGSYHFASDAEGTEVTNVNTIQSDTGGMFGKADKKTVQKALDASKLDYEMAENDVILLSAMGDDLPIGMMIVADDDNRTLNIYCYLLFDIPEEARAKLIPELNRVNNTINNGGFYMDNDEPKNYFKIVQSYFDRAPSVDTIRHLVMIAFKTVDVNDGNLKGLIPASAVRKIDYMYS